MASLPVHHSVQTIVIHMPIVWIGKHNLICLWLLEWSFYTASCQSKYVTLTKKMLQMSKSYASPIQICSCVWQWLGLIGIKDEAMHQAQSMILVPIWFYQVNRHQSQSPISDFSCNRDVFFPPSEAHYHGQKLPAGWRVLDGVSHPWLQSVHGMHAWLHPPGQSAIRHLLPYMAHIFW
jgi:hypothetical protein